MKRFPYQMAGGLGLVLVSSVALAAAPSEQTLTTVTDVYFVGALLCVVIFAVLVYFAKFQDKRMTPLGTLIGENKAIYSVGPEALVTECVRPMSTKKIGALIVMKSERLVGIFTERDALNKVLAVGLEPNKTKVSDVMTKDPYSVPPTTTVGDAMELVTRRHFRHLPVVKDGKVLAVVSSGDLTHWLVKDQIGEAQELAALAASA